MVYPRGGRLVLFSGVRKPQGWWKFDETSGAPVDSGTEGNNGTLIGAPTQGDPGIFQNGKAITFSGTNQGVDVAGVQVAGGSFTFSCWVNIDALTGTDWLMGPWAGSTEGGVRGLRIFDTGSGTIANFWCPADDDTDKQVTSSVTLVSNNWHFIVGVLDDVAKELRIYIGAVLRGTTDISGFTFQDQLAAGDFGIGIRSNDNSQDFDGTIDDARYYNFALSYSEIVALYRSTDGISRFHDLILRPTFDDAGTAQDYSDFGYNASVQSGPTTGVTGQINDCFTFDGVNDYIQFNNAGFLTKLGNIGTGNFTIAVWFKTGSSDDYMNVFSFGSDEPAVSVRLGDRLTIYDAGTGAVDSSTSETLDDDAWHHAAWVRTGTGANEFLFYLDGDAYGTAQYAYDIPVPTETFVAWNDVAGEYFDGELDDLRIYPYALTSSEITILAGMSA